MGRAERVVLLIEKDDGTFVRAESTDDGRLRVEADEIQAQFGAYTAQRAQAVDLNSLFYCHLWTLAGWERANVADYWIGFPRVALNTGEILLTTPATSYGLTIWTKKQFRYPYGGVRIWTDGLPTLPITGYLHIFGIEPGGGDDWGLYSLYMTGATFIGGGMDLTAYLPANYDSARHLYTMKLNRNNCEFYIDDVLRGLTVFVSPRGQAQIIAGPPYHIRLLSAKAQGLTHSPAFIEITIDCDENRLDLPPGQFRVMDGDPCPPRIYQLYQTGTNTLFEGSTIAAGSLTSHPFPLAGYEKKTVYFQADQRGTLSIETLMETGNWREYDSVFITNDELEPYPIRREAVLGRVVFTPDTYPCDVDEAEAVLR